MKKEKEQIQEMTDIIERAKKMIWNATNLKKEGYDWHSKAIAEFLYSENVRKIDETEVVYTSEKIKEINEKIFSMEKENSELCDDIDSLIYKLKQARKETASKIISAIDKALHDLAMQYANAGHTTYFAVCENVHHAVASKVAKQFGVEVE